ncbi:MAG TPA: hypothetical protein ENG63_05275 [Candidatus Desulfofervidus auxilii]|uniref:Uncharacterized protein n=1 Tax=Desulfofervidus auxilii TaxID=1621989 RepID=A0A7C0U2X3_DESA2|nr:hypothetical protein [Candidatus Desulfofervidus auxilii]
MGYEKYEQLDTEKYRNRYSSIKTSSGSLEIKVP